MTRINHDFAGLKKLEVDMLKAIFDKKNWRNSNTEVTIIPASSENGSTFGTRAEIRLHDNPIATYWYDYGKVDVDVNTLRLHPTMTTKSRLKALGANVYTKKGVTYLDDKEI